MVLSAFDVWAGHLMLDNAIANTDSHHENWGVPVSQVSDVASLAASFDHGSSLAFNVDELVIGSRSRSTLETHDRVRPLFADAGEHEVKGVPDCWHLYRVVDS